MTFSSSVEFSAACIHTTGTVFVANILTLEAISFITFKASTVVVTWLVDAFCMIMTTIPLLGPLSDASEVDSLELGQESSILPAFVIINTVIYTSCEKAGRALATKTTDSVVAIGQAQTTVPTLFVLTSILRF